MSNDLFRLDDKVVAVTGGQGQLGRQFTSALLRQGAKVAVLDVAVDGERDEAGCYLLPCDITSKSSVAAATLPPERRTRGIRRVDAAAGLSTLGHGARGALPSAVEVLRVLEGLET